MIELIEIPWSPFCIVQHRILGFSGVRFKVTNLPYGDRSRVWKLTRERYYQVPAVRDGRAVIFETDEHSQVIAKYLDNKLQLGLFPDDLRGLQTILWLYIEGEIEDLGFRLNDIYWREMVPKSGQLEFLRHKERKFGRGCVEGWKAQQQPMLEQLGRRLLPLEQMLAGKPFLLGARPYFVDFDLYGMLGNFLFSGHYELPAAHTRLQDWHARMTKITK